MNAYHMTPTELRAARENIKQMAIQADPAFAKLAARIYEPGIRPLLDALAGVLIGKRLAGDEFDAFIQELTPYAIIQQNAARYGYPFYAVSKPLATALLHTDLPDVWRKDQIPMGFPGIYFLLPEGVLVGEDGEPIPVLGVTIERIHPPGEPAPSDLFLVGAVSPDTGRSWHGSQRFDASGEMDLSMERPFWKGESAKALGEAIDETGARQTISKMMALAVQLLFVMAERPAYAKSGEHLKTIKKTKREVWSVPTLGRAYVMGRRGRDGKPLAPGERAMAHEHVVQGHRKTQWFGKGHAQSKSIWVEPYCRCLDD